MNDSLIEKVKPFLFKPIRHKMIGEVMFIYECSIQRILSPGGEDNICFIKGINISRNQLHQGHLGLDVAEIDDIDLFVENHEILDNISPYVHTINESLTRMMIEAEDITKSLCDIHKCVEVLSMAVCETSMPDIEKDEDFLDGDLISTIFNSIKDRDELSITIEEVYEACQALMGELSKHLDIDIDDSEAMNTLEELLEYAFIEALPPAVELTRIAFDTKAIVKEMQRNAKKEKEEGDEV